MITEVTILISLIVVIASQCMSISNHQIVHLKYMYSELLNIPQKKKQLQIVDGGKHPLRMKMSDALQSF